MRVRFSCILFLLASIMCYGIPVFVGNASFEEPADGKHNMWDAGTNGKGTFTDVPYWTSDTDAADSGVEAYGTPVDGTYRGFLMSTDPAVWQITSEPIAPGVVYTLSV